MLNTIATYVWSRIPWWIKVPLVVWVFPLAVIITLIFFLWVQPWYRSEIHATIAPYEERRDAQIIHLMTSQAIRDEAILGRLERMDTHINLIYQAQLNSARQSAR